MLTAHWKGRTMHAYLSSTNECSHSATSSFRASPINLPMSSLSYCPFGMLVDPCFAAESGVICEPDLAPFVDGFAPVPVPMPPPVAVSPGAVPMPVPLAPVEAGAVAPPPTPPPPADPPAPPP